jgi:hypothetical protein
MIPNLWNRNHPTHVEVGLFRQHGHHIDFDCHVGAIDGEFDNPIASPLNVINRAVLYI